MAHFVRNHTKPYQLFTILYFTINGENCDGLVFRHLELPETEVPTICEVCEKTFRIKEELGKHMDDMHFNPCPICEKIFYRTVEKQNHMSEHYKQALQESIPSEEIFNLNIQRQSTLIGHGRITKVNVEFTGEVLEQISPLSMD